MLSGALRPENAALRSAAGSALERKARKTQDGDEKKGWEQKGGDGGHERRMKGVL